MNLICIGAALLAVHSGTATTFSAKADPQNPMPMLACTRRDLDDRRDMVVASRDLPCGTRLLLYLPRRNRTVIATVAERGPFGRKRDGSFRSQLDLAPAVKRALHHNGYEPLTWMVIR